METTERRGVLTHSEQISEIVAALVKFQGAISNPKTTSDNPFYHSKYADLAEIWNVIRAPLSDCGLAIIQGGETRDVVDTSFGQINTVVRVETMLAHASGQWFRFALDMTAVPKKIKTDEGGEAVVAVTPQAIGSCMTYGRRYGLAAILGIAQEDDDGNAASGGDGVRRQAAQKAPPVNYKEVVGKLYAMGADTRTTRAEVSAYLAYRKPLLEKLPKEAQVEIKTAYDALMKVIETEEQAAQVKPPEKKAEVPAAAAADWKGSMACANKVIEALGAAQDSDTAQKVMNDLYVPNQAKMEKAHQAIVEAAFNGVINRLVKEDK